MNYCMRFLLAIIITITCSGLGWMVNGISPDVKKSRRDIVIVAKQYDYRPNRIIVNQGDEIHVKLGAFDVVHGFYLEGYDIEAEIYPGRLPFRLRKPSQKGPFELAEEIVFTADKPGKFRYRCSVTCGPLHPFMLGELIVRPNRVFGASMGGALGIFIAAFFLMFTAKKSSAVSKN
jgi:heme/copper-type cytochrome/quinol oxidase subunit 2